MAFPSNIATIRFFAEELEGVEYTLEAWHSEDGLHECPEHIAVISSRESDLDIEKFIHKTAQIVFDCHEDDNPQIMQNGREMKGIITKVEVHADEENQFLYTFHFCPTLWALTRSNNTYIFQKKSSPDIIKAIFEKASIACDFKLTSDPPEREFCVQYQETDYDFISRLSEEDGYFFYIDQKEDRVILTDDIDSLPKTDPLKTFAWDPGEGLYQPIPETVTALEFSHASVIEKVLIKDYNYLTPEDTLMKEKSTSEKKALGVIYEVYSKHTNAKEGEEKAQKSIEAKCADAKSLKLETTCRSVAAGSVFTLKDYPGESYNRDYVIRNVQHKYEDHHYSNVIECFPTSVTFRPPKKTPRPYIGGVHTGVVTGPSGEEIYTDDKKLGRIKVRLNWDISDTSDEESSCWMRIARTYAGANWGHHFMPRAGNEVLVIFIDGDPDRPLVIGSVHNASNIPPVKLPEDKYQNIIFTPFGHKIILEDKSGSEKIELFTKDKQNYISLDHGSGGHQIKIESIQGKMDVNIKKTITTKTEQDLIVEAKGNVSSTSKLKTTIKSKNDFTLNSGAKTTVTSDGQMNVTGKQAITIQGSSGGDVKITQGAGTIKIDPAGNIEISGVSITIRAMGIVQIQGSMVQIN
ncbi:type VI secretion system tip protein VgrG [bacterium]|nr:type VI secretion system tip protein VgrG [candidate division CSSED10-310 bacterium]